MQRVEIVYHYVYVKVPRRVSGGGGMATLHGLDEETLRRLEKEIAKLQKLRKLHRTNKAIDEILAMMSKIMHLIRMIPSAGIQRMLSHAMAAAMHQLKSGDITGAANSIADLLSLATKSKELCDDIMGNIMKLRHGGGVTGPAAQALFNMSFAAERALNHAGSLDTLMMIKDLTDEGVKIMNKLSSEKPGSKEYEALCGALANLTQDLVLLGQEDAMKQEAEGGGTTVGMDPDRNEIVGGIDALIENAIRQLKKRKDPDEQRKAEQLGADLRGALKAGRDNGADLDGLGQEIQQLLSSALDGGLDGAVRDAHQLCENQERITRLRPTLDAKLDHLEDATNELQGPAAKAMRQLKDALKHDCDRCTDPEAMIAMDTEMARCLELANKLSKLPPGEQLRCPEYRQLLIILRKRCQPSEGPMGRDRFGSQPAAGTAPLRAPGTRRLEEDQWVIPSLEHLEKQHHGPKQAPGTEGKHHHHHHHPKDEVILAVEIQELQAPGKHHHHADKDPASGGTARAGRDLPSPGASETIEIDIRVGRKGHEAKHRHKQPDVPIVIVAERERLHHHHRPHPHKHPTASVELPKEAAKLGRPAGKPKAEHCDPHEIDAAVAAIAVIQQGKSANPGT